MSGSTPTAAKLSFISPTKSNRPNYNPAGVGFTGLVHGFFPAR
jgi:hypothetical protein